MKKTHKILFSAIGLVLATGMAISQPSVEPSGESLLIGGIETSNGAILRVTGPNGYRFAQEFSAGGDISVDLKDTPFARDGKALSELSSGVYNYELTSRPGGKTVRGTFRIGDAPQNLPNPRTFTQEELSIPAERQAVTQAASTTSDDFVYVLDTAGDGITDVSLFATGATNWKMQNKHGLLAFQDDSSSSYADNMTLSDAGHLTLVKGGLTTAGGITSNGTITSTGGLTTSTANGKVGIGTNIPLFPLEINNANSVMTFTDTDGGSSWKLQNVSGDFSIGTTGLSGTKVVIIKDGSLANSLVISSAGVSVTSSRSAKTNIKQTSPEQVLEKLADLPIYTWSYTKDKSKSVHIGPMAEEFHQRFGFGDDAKRISSLDTGGLALAGVKALQEELNKRDAEIAELKSQVALLIEKTK